MSDIVISQSRNIIKDVADATLGDVLVPVGAGSQAIVHTVKVRTQSPVAAAALSFGLAAGSVDIVPAGTGVPAGNTNTLRGYPMGKGDDGGDITLTTSAAVPVTVSVRYTIS